MIKAFDHIHFVCKDVEETAKFFETFLEAKIKLRGEMRGKPMISMDLQEIAILLTTATTTEMLSPREGKRGLDHIGVQVQDLSKTIKEMKEKRGIFSLDYTVANSPSWPVPIKIAFLEGPDGIHVEIVERP